MRTVTRFNNRHSSMGRRDFLRTLGATTAGAAGIAGIMGPFDIARAAITPGEKGIYITNIYKSQLSGVGGIVIRIDTNKGISGYGECRDADNNASAELTALKPTILGMNPTQVDKVFAAIKNYGSPFATAQRDVIPRATGAMSGIETACWDITGRVYNVPVHKLLGPKLYDKIMVYADTDQKTVSTLPTYVTKRINLGFKWYKMDMYLTQLCTSGTDYTTGAQNSYGYSPYIVNDSAITKYQAYARTYRSMIGTYPLNSDHYQGWGNKTNQLDVASAVKIANAMAASDCQGLYGGWVEDIIDWWWNDENGVPVVKQVHDQITIPNNTGEDMYCIDEFKPFVDYGASTYIHPDPTTAGGVHQTRLSAMYAYSKGVKTAHHMSGGPVAFAMGLHIAAGIPDFLAQEYHHTDDSCNPWYFTVVDGFVTQPNSALGVTTAIIDGYVTIPSGPGLGINPNSTWGSHASAWTQV